MMHYVLHKRVFSIHDCVIFNSVSSDLLDGKIDTFMGTSKHTHTHTKSINGTSIDSKITRVEMARDKRSLLCLRSGKHFFHGLFNTMVSTEKILR